MAGFGRTEITPQLGTRLGGYPEKERPAEIINDPLYATSLVLQQGDCKIAIVSLDWLLVEAEEVEHIRQEVRKHTDISKMNVTVCATHSHTTANTISVSGWGNKEQDYIAGVMPQIIESVIKANKTLSPVSVGITSTQSNAGVSRRGIQQNNLTGFLGDPDEPYDSTMTVIRFEGAGGPIGTIIHYGAHATCIGTLRIVSRDWPGVMVDRIEQQVHAPVIFINGTMGDVGPRTNAIYGEGIGFCAGVGDGLIAAMEVGLRAASDALVAWLSIKEFRDDLILKTVTREILLPYAPLPLLDQAKNELMACESGKDEWGDPMCNYQYWKRVVEAYAKPILKDEAYFQTITNIGHIAIVPIPGEPFSSIGRRLRKFSPFAYTLCAGASNGSNGYFVAREARHRGGYEPWVGRGHKTYLYSENIDDVLVGENLKLLKEIKKGD